MERSVKAAKVLVAPQPDKASPSLGPEAAEGEEVAASSSSNPLEAIEAFSRRLEDIIHVHGSAAGLLDKTVMMETDIEKMEVEPKGDMKVGTDTDISLIMQTLNKLPSSEAKLEVLVKKYAELAGLHHCDEQKTSGMQKKMAVLLEERKQLQAEQRSSIAARCKLETLCRELQSHYNVLREETLQRCKEEEGKRTEMSSHFQEMLKEIQAQIEQHSARNDRLCQENSNLTEKLESLMNQCELRDESVEKINNHRDLQHKLTEAKLHQATAQLTEATEKHTREKEYLLREAIDKTKKCFAMKEQELAMKKKLTLYAQKFDEFQATLAKSNEIYIRFKKEMDNMSEKMKKVEKESNVWKTRFENCNKALTDMIEERTEKSKDYELFVLKIHNLEKLCRSLQEERKGLYEKIKEVRLSNANIPLRVLGLSNHEDGPDVDTADKSALLTPEELQEIQEEDPVLTEDMSRLREQQAKLQEFAESLLTTSFEKETEEEVDLEEDVVASAFDHFRTKTKAKEDTVSVPQKAAKTDLLPPTKVEEVPKITVPPQENSTPDMIQIDDKIEAPAPKKTQTDENIETPTPEIIHAEQKPEVKTQAETQQVKPDEDVQRPNELEPRPEPEKDKAGPQREAEATKSEVLEETGEVKPVEDKNTQQKPIEEESKPSASGPPTEHTSETTTASNNNSTKKQVPKKKKKKGGKNAS